MAHKLRTLSVVVLWIMLTIAPRKRSSALCRSGRTTVKCFRIPEQTGRDARGNCGDAQFGQMAIVNEEITTGRISAATISLGIS
jgi:hypothetical protein